MILIPFTNFELETELSAKQIEEKLASITGKLDNIGSLDHLSANPFNTSFTGGTILLKKSPPNRMRETPIASIGITEKAASRGLEVNMRYSWLKLIFYLIFFGFVFYLSVGAILGGLMMPVFMWGALAVGGFFLLFTLLAYSIVISLFAVYVGEYKRFLQEELQAKELTA